MHESSRPVNVLLLWLLWGWSVMMLTHELGHVAGGLAGGGVLVVLELRPWHLPYSFFQPDPHPAITLWSGPLAGCVIPLLAALGWNRPAVWFVAWFCVVSNAAYLLLGYFSGDPELDSTKMLATGTHPAVLVIVAATLLGLGYYRFRACCKSLFSGAAKLPSRRQLRFAAGGWIALTFIQSIIGGWIAR